MTFSDLLAGIVERGPELFAVLASGRALVLSRAARIAADAEAVKEVVIGLRECRENHAKDRARLDALARELTDFRNEATR